MNPLWLLWDRAHVFYPPTVLDRADFGVVVLDSAEFMCLILDNADFKQVIIDRADFSRYPSMNTQLVTTGVEPLVINSAETFQLSPSRNGRFWDLSGGTATLRLVSPTGSAIAVTASITSSGVLAAWTVIAPAGDWRRAWDVTDAAGTRQVTKPIGFGVIASP